MKKILALAAAALMLLSMAACSKTDKTSDDDSATVPGTTAPAVTTTEKAPAKLITSGRLSALEAPDGWMQEHSASEGQLVYSLGGEDSTQEFKPELCINFDEYTTPEEFIELQKKNADEMGKTYTVETKTIAGVEYQYFIPSYSSSRLFGEKDGVTVCITIDERISIDEPGLIDIISSISVAPEA